MAGVAHSQLNIIVKMQTEAAKAQLKALKNIGSQITPGVDKTVLVDQGREYIKQQKILQQFRDIYGEVDIRTKEAAGNVKQMGANMGLTNKQIARAQHRTKAFNFDFLSLMFAGMMLQRAFGGMITSILEGYKKIMGQNSAFIKSTNKLSASWSYLKFSMASALDNPIIVNAVEYFTDLIEKLGDYLSEHPGLSAAILAVISALAVIGTLSVIASGVMQVKKLIEIFSTATASHAVANMKAVGGISTANFIPIILGVGAVIAVFGALFALLLGDKTAQTFVLNVIGWITKLVINTTSLLLKGAAILTNGLDLLLKQFIDSLNLFAKLTYEVIGSSGILVIIKAYRGWLRLTNQITDAQEKQTDALINQIKRAKDANVQIAKGDFINQSVTNLEDMFSAVDEKVNLIDFNKTNLKEDIDDTLKVVGKGIDILKDKQSAHTEVITINDTAQSNLIDTVNNFSNETLPNSDAAIDANIAKLNSQTAAYNRAKKAIERYNDALAQKNRSSHSFVGPTRSTTTRSSGGGN